MICAFTKQTHDRWPGGESGSRREVQIWRCSGVVEVHFLSNVVIKRGSGMAGQNLTFVILVKKQGTEVVVVQ